MKVLTSWEAFGISRDTIKENKRTADGRLVLKGVLQKADVLNQNGRIYPAPILEREVRNYQKLIKERRALGECDHPDSSVIELKNSSHLVTKAWMESNVVYGEIELLNTPGGKILQELVDAGVTLGISSRGVGSTKRDGDRQIVQDDFHLICWDFVSEPSTPGAFMMRENKMMNNSNFITEAELNQFFDKTDRVDRIFNEIITWGNIK